MKKRTIKYLVALLAMAALVIIGVSSCAMLGNLFGNKNPTEVQISWDEALTSGVTRITNDGLFKRTVSVSPDGLKLLYAEATKTGNWSIMYLRDANNPAKTPLIGEIAYDPSWYEDSTRFVYISYERSSGRLVRSSAAGGSKTYITRTAIGDNDAVPVIKKGVIVCSSWVNNQWQIVTVNENGSEPTFMGQGIWPSWHPKENKIVFIRNPNDPSSHGGGSIYEMDMNSGQATQIYHDPQALCYQPSYSPDGKRILFSKGTEVRKTGTLTVKNLFGTSKSGIGSEEETTHIYVMNVDGTNVSPLSGGSGVVSSPSWGKDGEVFCLVGMPGEPKEIYKLRIKD